MAEARNMTVDKFKEKLAKSENSNAKKKTDDSAQTKKELKKFQKQVKKGARISDDTKSKV